MAQRQSSDSNGNSNSGGGKLMPNIDEQSTRVLNLTVLQRIDPYVEEILITAAHVTLYEFNLDLTQWSRKDVEGSLFVVKRNAQPRFQFIVMNRRNTENLVENLLGGFEFEVQVPYLLYRNAAQEVNGIWFYNAGECEEVANLFSRILNAYSKVPQRSNVSVAKSEFEELEARPSMAVMDCPLEPSTSASSSLRDIPDERSFVNFFSAALTMGTATSAKTAGQAALTMGTATSAKTAGQPYESSAVTGPLSHSPCAPSLSIPNLQVPSPMQASIPLMQLLDSSELNSSGNRTENLVRPSTFYGPVPTTGLVLPPISSSLPTAPPLQPAASLQRPYGAPILQPFPPPTPPPSLTPVSVADTNYSSAISRDKVRDALLALVQDDQFIDMVCRALQNAHNP